MQSLNKAKQTFGEYLKHAHDNVAICYQTEKCTCYGAGSGIVKASKVLKGIC